MEKTNELATDFRAEVRKANIHTLENIIMTHGDELSEIIWKKILH